LYVLISDSSTHPLFIKLIVIVYISQTFELKKQNSAHSTSPESRVCSFDRVSSYRLSHACDASGDLQLQKEYYRL